MRVLLTGATGFIGRRLASTLTKKHGVILTCSVRESGAQTPGIEVTVGDLNEKTEWSVPLADQEVVVHLAARAHILRCESADPLAEFRRVNVDGTLKLACRAAEAGVERFVFISSIGVLGNNNCRPFTENDRPNPAGPYAQSKLEAELGLLEIGRKTGMEIVVVRAPLVYGPNAPGSFGTLVRMVEKGIPLPLGAVDNRRSLVALDNLVDLIVTCIDHPAAADQIFLVGDGEDLSTPELLRRVGAAVGKRARLISVPTSLLQFGATVLGRKTMAQQLLGSLQVDIAKIQRVLGWVPPLSLDEGLSRCFKNNLDE